MRMSTLICGAFVAGVLFFFGDIGTAAAQQTIHQAYTTQATYRTDSAEASEIARWLQQHAKYDADAVNASSGTGTVRVTYTASSASLQPMTNPGPPVPLPGNGNPGDEITINHNSGGWQRTWTFVWRSNSAGSGWFQTRYEEVYVNTVPR